jgi:hypothetical protein
VLLQNGVQALLHAISERKQLVLEKDCELVAGGLVSVCGWLLHLWDSQSNICGLLNAVHSHVFQGILNRERPQFKFHALVGHGLQNNGVLLSALIFFCSSHALK